MIVILIDTKMATATSKINVTKPKNKIWNFLYEERDGKKVFGICKYCRAKYVSHVNRMTKHIKSCLACPLSKKKILEDSSNEKAGKQNTTAIDISNGASDSDADLNNDEVGNFFLYLKLKSEYFDDAYFVLKF